MPESQHPSQQKNRRRARRKAPKRGTRAVCRTGKWGLGPNVAVAVLDVSETGARLRICAECALGDEVELELSNPCLPRPHRVLADVVWCVRTDAEDYLIGLNFRKPLPFKELQQL